LVCKGPQWKPFWPKNPPEFAPNTGAPDGADRRAIGNLVIEARKFSGLAIDTLVELTKDNHTHSTRFAAATALLDRGYGRPAQSLDLHLSADAITKRLSDMSDAELATLEQRMIAVAPIVLEATADVLDDLDDAGELPDGDVEDSPPDALAYGGQDHGGVPVKLGVRRPAWGNCSVFDGRCDEPQLRFHWHFGLPLILTDRTSSSRPMPSC
jgi:hypothetical protein